MPDEHTLALRQADQARSDFYAIGDDLEFIKSLEESAIGEGSECYVGGSGSCQVNMEICVGAGEVDPIGGTTGAGLLIGSAAASTS